MTHKQREALSQRTWNFYCHTAKKSLRTTRIYFKKQNIPQSIVYYLMKREKIFLEMIVRSNYPRKIGTHLLNLSIINVVEVNVNWDNDF